MTTPTGEIEIFLGSVGRSPDEPSQIAALIGRMMPDPFEVEEIDHDDVPTSTFWEYRQTGVEVKWRGPLLVAVDLFVQESVEQGYPAYPRRLCNEFPNTATREEIEAALGSPDATGEWNGAWIRYDYGVSNLHITLDGEGRAAIISASVPV